MRDPNLFICHLIQSLGIIFDLILFFCRRLSWLYNAPSDLISFSCSCSTFVVEKLHRRVSHHLTNPAPTTGWRN